MKVYLAKRKYCPPTAPPVPQAPRGPSSSMRKLFRGPGALSKGDSKQACAFPPRERDPGAFPPLLGPVSAFRGRAPGELHQGHTGALRGGVREPTHLRGLLGDGVGTSVAAPGLPSGFPSDLVRV